MQEIFHKKWCRSLQGIDTYCDCQRGEPLATKPPVTQREPFMIAELRKARVASKMNERLTFTFYAEDVGQALYEYDLQREEAQRVEGLLAERDEMAAGYDATAVANFMQYKQRVEAERDALRLRVDALQGRLIRLTDAIAMRDEPLRRGSQTAAVSIICLAREIRAALEATQDPAKESQE